MIKVVRLLPPSDSCRIRVNLESRYGIWADYTIGVESQPPGNPEQAKFTKTKRKEYLAVSQGVDDHAQSTQTFVNLLGLLERLSTGSRLANLFTSREINQKERPCLLGPRLGVALLYGDNKDGMRARGFSVHIYHQGGGRGSAISDQDSFLPGEMFGGGLRTSGRCRPSIAALSHNLIHLFCITHIVVG